LVTPALGRLRQEDQKFKVITGYMASLCLKKKKKRKKIHGGKEGEGERERVNT
jgi:hypothetical protein